MMSNVMKTSALTQICAVLVGLVVLAQGWVLPAKPVNKVSPLREFCHDDMHGFVKVGYTWQDRCMKCRCDQTLGLVCDTPPCKNPYKPYHKQACVKWSDDGCCCDEFGCKVDGQIYQLNQSFPFPPGDPCGQCLCEMDIDHRTCSMNVCPAPVCVDAYRRTNECCPRCPAGPNCGIPFIEGVTSFNNRDLYKPLQLGRSKTLKSNINPLLLHVCKCLIPGTPAICEQTAFSWLG